MARDRIFADVLQELYDAKLTGAYFITMKQSSEDLFKIFTRNGEVVAATYGSAVGQDALDILEYYTLQSGTFFKDTAPPEGTQRLALPTKKFIELMRKAKVMIRVA